MSNPNDLSGENSTLMFFLVLAKMRSGRGRTSPAWKFFYIPLALLICEFTVLYWPDASGQ
jgi:hypothetical protein